MFAIKVEFDDESIRSIILAIDLAIDVHSLLLFDEFFVLSAFASDSVLAIALRTLFNINGVPSAAFLRALQTLCDRAGGVGDKNSPSASHAFTAFTRVYATTIGRGCNPETPPIPSVFPTPLSPTHHHRPQLFLLWGLSSTQAEHE
jgi:hypothetical protein